jgi:hypothetical protein
LLDEGKLGGKHPAHFLIKLMQILEIIEKKLDKESGSRKSGSHRRTKSDSSHHQHSPMLILW